MELFDFLTKCRFHLTVTLPRDVRVEHWDDRLKFIGTTNGIVILVNELRKIAKLKDGQLAKVDRYVFKVSDYMTEDRFKANWIELPGRAWNVLGSKFLEVTEGREENPFYFNSCGYTEKIPIDIGVEVTDLK